MLTKPAYRTWCDRLGLTDQARLEIAAIRESPPSRLVRSRKGNVPSRYPSVKMGHTIQAESHTVELPFVHILEQDDDVLEYWDQPPSFTLTYRSKSGRRVVAQHTPDYFVLRRDSAGWVECKPETTLLTLQNSAPGRYQWDREEGEQAGAGGRWRCPPGEAAALERGSLTYTVWSDAELNWVEQRNWEYLADYLCEDHMAVRREVAEVCAALVAAEPGISLARLQLNARSWATADDLNILIAQARLYVDLRVYALAEPDYAPVYVNRITAQAYALQHSSARDPVSTLRAANASEVHRVDLELGTFVVWDGRPWRIGNLGESKLTLVTPEGTAIDLQTDQFDAYVRAGHIVGRPIESGGTQLITTPARDLLAAASTPDQQVVNTRYRLIRQSLDDHVPPSDGDGVTQRTKQRWIKAYREAEAHYGNGYVGLLPRYRYSPRQPRILTDEHMTLLRAALDEHWATFRNKRLIRACEAFVVACEQHALHAPSLRTFYTEAHRYLNTHDKTLAQAGKRAAYPYQAPYLADRYRGSRHGDFPWACAYLDHTELDLELRSSLTGRLLGRPWITMLVDGRTRRILAIFPSFSRPSYVSCMLAIRLCVQRWGRLPRTIVVDGGREFHSVYFETLLAWYRVTHKTRPPGEPRYGAVGERLFGTENTEFTYNLLGNTQLTKNPRMLSHAVNPKTHAHWTLGDVYDWMCAWAYEEYDTHEHFTLGQSPRDAYVWEQSRSGQRPACLIPYDRDFIFRTLPTTRKGTALVQPGKGIKVNTIYYWSNQFAHPEVERTAVEVRYDPWDAGLAFAYLRSIRSWIDCQSEYYAALHLRSEKELALIATELRKQRHDHTKRLFLDAKRFAAFQQQVEQHEDILLQRERDAESRALVARTLVGLLGETAGLPLIGVGVGQESASAVSTLIGASAVEDALAPEALVSESSTLVPERPSMDLPAPYLLRRLQ